MKIDAKALRHPKEKMWGSVMIFFGVLFWLLIIGAAIGALSSNEPNKHHLFWIYFWYAFTFAVIIFIRHAFTRAYIFGHYVLIGTRQFPRLYDMVVRGADDLGMATPPASFVHNSAGVMNAMALRLLGSRYVWLTSALIDADRDEQVRFVIGHELGHHALGHLDFWRNLLRGPGYAVPFVAAAYSRGRELSCDRVGAALAQDLPASLSALQMLASGSARLNAEMDVAAFERQEAMVPALSGWLLHIFSPYPRLTKRVAELRRYVSGDLA